MSLLARFAPVSNIFKRCLVPEVKTVAPFHTLNGNVAEPTPGGLFSVITRNIIRIHFPRPSERRRVKRHGWHQRMKTPEGRRVLMNRILKGRFVYSH